jgi:hypothetical protein
LKRVYHLVAQRTPCASPFNVLGEQNLLTGNAVDAKQLPSEAAKNITLEVEIRRGPTESRKKILLCSEHIGRDLRMDVCQH